MKRSIVLLMIISALLLPGCKPKHPAMIKIDPEFNPNNVGMILVAPVMSSISEGNDPERESERISNRVLTELLSQRMDHSFLSREQLRYAMAKAKIAPEYEYFEETWIKRHEADRNFLFKLRKSLEFDLMLISHIYLWNKDEADYREEGTASSTQVGANMALVDPRSGLIVWEATDENYKESVRTEGGRVRSASGGIERRIEGVTVTGRDMYAAPPYEDVVILVLEALMNAIPERGRLEK